MTKLDARKDPVVFMQAMMRFGRLVCEAAHAYGLKAEHIIGGNHYKSERVAAARMDLLQVMDREYILSMPQLAILFRYQHHTTILLMRRRIDEGDHRSWKLPLNSQPTGQIACDQSVKSS